MRAVTMAAGVRHQRPTIARGAGDLHLGAGLCAAVLHGRQCPQVVGCEAVSVLRAKVGGEGVVASRII